MWAKARVEQGWDGLSADQQKHVRLDPEARCLKGLKPMGGKVALEAVDPFVKELLDAVKVRVESERLKGNSVGFEDIKITFKNKIMAERKRRDEVNLTCDARLAEIIEGSKAVEDSTNIIENINKERLPQLNLSGSDGWVASKLEKLAV